MTQFHSWLQRRRQHQHTSVPRRKPDIDSKTHNHIPSTPTFLGTPRLARLHQRIFKQPSSSTTSPTSEIPSPTSITEIPLLTSAALSDDSDQQFVKQETPVRIYLPARTSPTIRHVRIIETNNTPTPPMSKITSPTLNRRQLLSSIKVTTITNERRENLTSSSNNLDNN